MANKVRPQPGAGEAELLGLIGLIYDAAIEPKTWPVFLDRLVHDTDSRSALLVWQNRQDLSVEQTIGVGFDPAARRLYDETYWDKDIWTLAVARMEHNRVFSSGILVPDKTFRKSTIYNEFCKPQGVEHTAGAMILAGESRLLRFAVQRTRRQGHWPKSGLDLLGKLLPHLQRAIEIERYLGQSAKEIEALMQASPWACFVVDARRRMAALSYKARELLGPPGPWRIVNGVLVVLDGRIRRVIDVRLADCVQTLSTGEGRGGGTTRISRIGQSTLTISVLPVRGPDRYCIVVFDPDRDRSRLNALAAQEAYGLTTAEARVANELVWGRATAELQVALGITKNTLKTHLAAIYRKTETDRVAQLVACFLANRALWSLEPDRRL